MKDNNSYLFTSFVPQIIEQKVLSIRNILAIPPYSGGAEKNDVITKNHPHITMKRACYLKNECTEDELINIVSRVTFPPIPVVSKKWELFESPTSGTVLAAIVEKNDLLKKLHFDIYDLIEPYTVDKYSQYQKNDFTPHVSIIYELTNEKKVKAIEMLKKLFPLKFTITSLFFLGSKSETPHTRVLMREIYAKN